jgi:uncharacterized protein (DUF1778 family)
MSTAGAAMAKKKKPAKAKTTRNDDVRIRMTSTYKDWLGRFAEAQRKDMSDLVDEALMRMAKAEGFDPPPKR